MNLNILLDVIITCTLILVFQVTICSGRILELKHFKNVDMSNKVYSGSELTKQTGRKLYYTQVFEISGTGENLTGSPPPQVDANAPMNMNTFGGNKWYNNWSNYILVVLFILSFVLLGYYVNKKLVNMAKEREILKSLAKSPEQSSIVPETTGEERKSGEAQREELVFFDEEEKFKMEDLLEATADLRNQTYSSSLYKVVLTNKKVYAVKRLKKLQVGFDEFQEMMKRIGKLKHRNILSLVGYNSTNEEKLLFYKYQPNGSLLNLFEDHMERKREFPWKLRLSIACGIARGLNYIYQNPEKHLGIPHGNLKLSNILLDENNQPLISEYGLSGFVDSRKNSLSGFAAPTGYTAPEKTMSEQGDIYSFGIILLELLTGKTVEKTGTDLPKWVRAVVREEWTGEVLDKEVSASARESAFPLLNAALKCVSNSPEDRPAIAEVLEKIEELENANDDVSSIHSEHGIDESCQKDCILHSVIPETWDTPASNY